MPYEHKRIERPLLVQTKRDDRVLASVEKSLTESLAAVQAERERLATPVNVEVKTAHTFYEPYRNSVASEVYRDASKLVEDVLIKHGIGVKEWTTGPLKGEQYVDSQLVRALTTDSFRLVWDEAIELAAQITGGAQGTLIRDLKEDRLTIEQANEINSKDSK